MLTDRERREILDRLAAYGGPYAPKPGSLTLPPEQWRALGAMLVPKRVAKGERFLDEGEPANPFAVVRSGLLRFFYVDADGSEATKAFRGPCELAAAYSEMLLGIPSRTIIEALEDTEMLVGDYARVSTLYARNPCWQEVGRRIAEHYYVEKERREFELLQLSATERYLRFSQAYPGLLGRIPQYHVASYLGITPVALSRIVSRLRKKR